MNKDEFWQLIDKAKGRAGSDLDARVEALRDALRQCTPAELQGFQNEYDRKIGESYRWDLWGAAYIINGGCSDDGFRYFRDWLISEGRGIYEKALQEPDSLADLPRVEFAELEGFGYVASQLYKESGAGELDRDFSTEGAEPAGQSWAEEDVGEMFPRLNAKYG